FVCEDVKCQNLAFCFFGIKTKEQKNTIFEPASETRKSMKRLLSFIFLLFLTFAAAQTKVSGIVVDSQNLPIPFASVIFKGSTEGTVTNEDGRFYIESPKNYTALLVSFGGYQDREIPLTKAVNYDFKIVLKETEALQEVVIYSGKTSKKNNPALDILRKIWE